MKIQYIRKLTASYMVLAQCEELQEWEKKMIAHAPKGNIVFAECVQENGEKYLWYNITGKQAPALDGGGLVAEADQEDSDGWQAGLRCSWLHL